MREILFRGKEKDSGKWVQGYAYKIWGQAFILWGMVNEVPDMIEVDTETVCQYTGLTDNNGDKIFDGDIIRKLVPVYKTGQKDPIGERQMIGSVFWDDSDSQFPGYWAISAKDEHGNNEEYIFTCKFEVIGNIYDNPELLEVD